MRRNAFRTNVYIRPLAYKCAERIGVSHRRSGRACHRRASRSAIICTPKRDCTPASAPGGASKTMRFPRAPRSAAPTSTARWPATKRAAPDSTKPSCSTKSGHVAEGATCNLFMVRKGKLITPPIDGKRARRHHPRLDHANWRSASWACRLWNGPSTAANSMCATSCSLPAPRWALRRWCASIIGR